MRPFACCAFNMDGATLGFDQPFGDRESQTVGAAVIGRVRADLIEAFEDVGQMFGGDARSVISHNHFNEFS